MNPFGISDKSYQILQQYFARKPNIEKVVIFGSRARGTCRNGSDIDLALFGTDLDEIRIKTELEYLPTPYMYDVLDYQKLEKAELKNHIDTIGKIFYQKPEKQF